MSAEPDPPLNDCDCCEVTPDPPPIFNAPGQPALRYRIDTQPTFLQRMIDALPHETVPPDSADATAPRPLAALTARASDDPSIALLDAWAVAADVLTFYQERFANEGFLRTATDRRSVLELAREIGYELSPGVAAGVDLAFTVENAVGAPDQVTVPIGTKVLSVPGPGQLPQTFETIEAIVARPEWNAFPPRRDDPEVVLGGMTDLFLAGTSTQLQVGDAILFVGGDRLDDVNSQNWDLRTLTAVEPDPPNKRTRVAWLGGLAVTSNATNTNKESGLTTVRVFAMRKRAQLFGHNAIQFMALSSDTQKSFLSAFGDDPKDAGTFSDWDVIPGSGFRVDSNSRELKSSQSDELTFDFDINDPKMMTGGWVVLAGKPRGTIAGTSETPGSEFPPDKLLPLPFPLSIGEDTISDPSLFVFDSTTEHPNPILFNIVNGPNVTSRTEFALSAQVTRVICDFPKPPSGVFINRRESMFFVESEELTLGVRPVIVPVDGKEETPDVPADQLIDPGDHPTGQFVAVGLSVQGLSVGQKIALVGKRPNVQVVDPNTLAARTKSYARVHLLEPGEVVPLVAALKGLLEAPGEDADPSVPGGLVLEDPPGAREPLSGHTFELLDQITPADHNLTVYNITIPLKTWTLRSRTGAKGTAKLPFFAVDTVPADPSGETIAEIRQIAAVFQGTSRMLLKLDKPLTAIYDRGTLTLSANVASATHGETVPAEVLGNGDPSVPNQTFELKKPPLTYTSSPGTPSGSESTLVVRVNGVEWLEKPALFGAAPDDQIYTVRRTNDGQTDLFFGDGVQGSRLPTGTSNVVATYRSGIGLGGQVAAGTLSLLTNRPLGVRAVNNPLAAAGAADPAQIDDARQNAPLTVRTIDRVVSVTDVEDFARSFAGVGKAQARLLWDGSAQVVQLTVGGADGKVIDPDSDLLVHLTDSLQANADPSLRLRLPLDSFDEHDFALTLALDIDDRFVPADVRTNVAEALLGAFSFAKRDFGQSVSEAEVVALVQTVPGVIAANVVSLTDEVSQTTSDSLPGAVAQFDQSGAFQRATLLLIDPAKLDVSQDLTP
jgi:hypothetical protein